MPTDDSGDSLHLVIQQAFNDNFPQIRSAVVENIEEVWGSLSDGPFNTDPFIEPRLEFLSERPNYTIDDDRIEDDRRRLAVTLQCFVGIRCEKYQDNGGDLPLTTTKAEHLVTYDVPVRLTLDDESRMVEDFEIGDLAWAKHGDWA
jgi:hypothetical protein